MESYGTRNEETLETRSAAEAVVQRVYLSVKELCIQPGDVRDRLRSAVWIISALNEKDLPNELREDYRWIIQASTKFSPKIPNYRSNLDETMKRIRRSTGQKIAERIFHIYSRLQEIRGFPLLEWRNPSE